MKGKKAKFKQGGLGGGSFLEIYFFLNEREKNRVIEALVFNFKGGSKEGEFQGEGFASQDSQRVGDGGGKGRSTELEKLLGQLGETNPSTWLTTKFEGDWVEGGGW